MDIIIGQSKFSFHYRSNCKIERFSVIITEPKFDQRTAIIRNQFSASPVLFLSSIDIRVRKTTNLPKSTIWQDANNNLKLITEF